MDSFKSYLEASLPQASLPRDDLGEYLNELSNWTVSNLEDPEVAFERWSDPGDYPNALGSSPLPDGPQTPSMDGGGTANMSIALPLGTIKMGPDKRQYLVFPDVDDAELVEFMNDYLDPLQDDLEELFEEPYDWSVEGRDFDKDFWRDFATIVFELVSVNTVGSKQILSVIAKIEEK